MAMPVLDPERFVFARLADSTHKLPVPGTRRFFSATEPEQVDSHDPYWRLPLADGSLRRVPAPKAAEAEALGAPPGASGAEPAPTEQHAAPEEHPHASDE